MLGLLAIGAVLLSAFAWFSIQTVGDPVAASAPVPAAEPHVDAQPSVAFLGDSYTAGNDAETHRDYPENFSSAERAVLSGAKAAAPNTQLTVLAPS